MIFCGSTSEQLFTAQSKPWVGDAKLNKYIIVHCPLFLFSVDTCTSLYSTVWHGGPGQPAKGKLIFAERINAKSIQVFV